MTANPETTFTPWTRKRSGWAIIARKEFADHILSIRFIALLVLLGLVGVGTVYAAATALKDAAPATANTPGLFLRLFSVQADPVPLSFVTFLGFLAPVLGIAFGFDAINGERSQGTLPRLVSQPIHRDDVINGKFVAGLSIVGLIITVISVLVAGVGIVMLGIVPSAGQVARLLIWLIATVLYVGVWLAFATFCSVIVRRASTSALLSIALWLVFALFGSLLAHLAAGVFSPIDQGNPESAYNNAQAEVTLARVSPTVLYQESSLALLNSDVRSVGLITYEQIDQALPSELSLTQSVLLVWPQLVSLLAITVVIFAFAYVPFMHQEVRA